MSGHTAFRELEMRVVIERRAALRLRINGDGVASLAELADARLGVIELRKFTWRRADKVGRELAIDVSELERWADRRLAQAMERGKANGDVYEHGKNPARAATGVPRTTFMSSHEWNGSEPFAGVRHMAVGTDTEFAAALVKARDVGGPDGGMTRTNVARALGVRLGGEPIARPVPDTHPVNIKGKHRDEYNRGRPRIKVARVVEESTQVLEGVVSSLALVAGAVDSTPEQLAEWSTRMGEALRAIGKFVREELTANG